MVQQIETLRRQRLSSFVRKKLRDHPSQYPTMTAPQRVEAQRRVAKLLGRLKQEYPLYWNKGCTAASQVRPVKNREQHESVVDENDETVVDNTVVDENEETVVDDTVVDDKSIVSCDERTRSDIEMPLFEAQQRTPLSAYRLVDDDTRKRRALQSASRSNLMQSPDLALPNDSPGIHQPSDDDEDEPLDSPPVFSQSPISLAESNISHDFPVVEEQMANLSLESTSTNPIQDASTSMSMSFAEQRSFDLDSQQALHYSPLQMEKRKAKSALVFDGYVKRTQQRLVRVHEWLCSRSEGVVMSLSKDQVRDIALSVILTKKGQQKSRKPSLIVCRESAEVVAWKQLFREKSNLSVLDFTSIAPKDCPAMATTNRCTTFHVVLATYTSLTARHCSLVLSEAGIAQTTTSTSSNEWQTQQLSSSEEASKAVAARLSSLHRVSWECLVLNDMGGRKSFLAKVLTARSQAAKSIDASCR